eukprot:GILI01034206.1.p1 GENE.GILI01034206.1~~GILI01034206.1.p1  ORF type:complete len:137 (-),score=31.39 GILI01034206.1:33-443(-)
MAGVFEHSGELEEEKRVAENEAKKKELQRKVNSMFANISQFLSDEMSANTMDYELIAALNNAALEKYKHLTNVAAKINASMLDAAAKYKELQPYLEQIDEIDRSINSLEQVINMLDDVTKRLEVKTRELIPQQKLI